MRKLLILIMVVLCLFSYSTKDNGISKTGEISTLDSFSNVEAPPKILDLALIEVDPVKYYLPTNFNSANTYAWGNCTWFVASQVKVPNSLGNANTWAYRASIMGFPVSSEPVIGAVAATTAGYLGHVAIVLDVINDQVLIKEMNSQGLGVISTRWVHKYSYKYIIFNPY